MANISLTNKCSRNCSYCFVKKSNPHNPKKNTFMTLHLFEQALDFLERSAIKQVRLLGGEPTLHPEFPQIIKKVFDRKLYLVIFSNGLLSEALIQLLEHIPKDKTTILINTATPGEALPDELRQQQAAFRRLGLHIVLGLNIHSRQQELDFLIDLIHKYHLTPRVRLGLAHPVLGAANHFLNPKFYPVIGEKIYFFIKSAQENGVEIVFDCGFVPCMFPSELFELTGKRPQDIAQRCNPILDILPDGNVISCYPLADLGEIPLPIDHDSKWLREKFSDRLFQFQKFGIYPQCTICDLFKQGICFGGCKAASMLRLRCDVSKSESCFGISISPLKNRKVSVFESIQDNTNNVMDSMTIPDSSRWVIPYIDQPFSFWEEIVDGYKRYIKEVYFPLPGFISGRPKQPDTHLESFLHQSPFNYSALINPITFPHPLEEVFPLVHKKICYLINEFGLTNVTTSNLLLAKRIREVIPELTITASVLMDIQKPNQILMINQIYDRVVPSNRIIRDIHSLKELRHAFKGKICLIVNEACLPGCPFRIQHFHEMCTSTFNNPQSLCDELLQEQPWLRLTGSWILPQHLHLYEGIFDELKLAGRVTLQDKRVYLNVLDSYIYRKPLNPNEIGGGPATILESLNISEEFFSKTLFCNHQCHKCDYCQNYWAKSIRK